MFYKGEPIWTSVLATEGVLSVSHTDQHFVWKMRPELVEALLSLPWGINSETDTEMRRETSAFE